MLNFSLHVSLSGKSKNNMRVFKYPEYIRNLYSWWETNDIYLQ